MHTQIFQRRSDLTLSIRLFIAYLLICQNRRGLVPKLCDKYRVSRTFIYDLRQKYRKFGSNEGESEQIVGDLGKLDNLSLILNLRMEGKCSSEGIHAVMARLGYSGNSVGTISETLHAVGSKLGGDLSGGNGQMLKYVFCSDEVFAKDTPILRTVEPLSMQILRIELAEKRDSES